MFHLLDYFKQVKRERRLLQLDKPLPKQLLTVEQLTVTLREGSVAVVRLNKERYLIEGYRIRKDQVEDYLLWDLDGRCISDILFRFRYDILMTS